MEKEIEVGNKMESMKLHESVEIKTETINSHPSMIWTITRVVGGWIYSYVRLDCNSMTSVFVPDKS